MVSSEFDDEATRRVLAALDKGGYPITAALWLYRPPEDEWEFILATPLVDELGPYGAYSRFRRASLGELPDSSLLLRSVHLISPSDPLVRTLQANVALAEGARARLSGIPVNGSLITDAYIYRLSRKGRTPSRRH